jgi:hypothetical protein
VVEVLDGAAIFIFEELFGCHEDIVLKFVADHRGARAFVEW